MKKETKEKIKELFKTFIPPIIVAFIVCNFLITNTLVPTGSMNDTIPNGARLIGNRLYKEVKRGDIIIFKENEPRNLTLIKRLIGMPGDIVEIFPSEEGGYISINGNKLNEPYIKEPMYVKEYTKYEVPDDSYFFLGDNRNYSLDARFWDNPYIKDDQLIAKASFMWFPIFKKL